VEALDQVWLIVYSFNQVLKSGVAKYLTYIEPGRSALQEVNRICFRGALFKEFDELYSSLFLTSAQKKHYILTVNRLCFFYSTTSASALINFLCAHRTFDPH